jgi:galactokinase
MKKFPDISAEKLDQAMVISKPSNGSFVYVFSSPSAP